MDRTLSVRFSLAFDIEMERFFDRPAVPSDRVPEDAEIAGDIQGAEHRPAPGDLRDAELQPTFGVEVYRGGSETPTQFDHGRAMCGAILIWTRGG